MFRTVGMALTSASAVLSLAAAAHAQSIWYVDEDGDAANGCSSWVDACPDLQTALGLATAGDQIWVAVGTYKPDSGTGDRLATFQLLSGVALYGGFDGTEPTLADRAGLFDQTILSGDLGGDDIADLVAFVACFSGDGHPPIPECESFDQDLDGDVDSLDGHIDDNSYHIVTGSGTGAATVLDGFTITAGNADAAQPDERGAGMFNEYADPTVTRCTFHANRAFTGGGMYNFASEPTVTACTFSGNASGFFWGQRSALGGTPRPADRASASNLLGIGGAGMSNWDSGPLVIDCAFNGNSTAHRGGGMSSGGSLSPKVYGCTFSRNAAPGSHGGGMYGSASYLMVVNCTFSGNTANFGGGLEIDHTHHATVAGTSFIGNTALHGGGMNRDLASSTTVTNCTFTGNSADYGVGGLEGSGGPVTNCIFWENVRDADGSEGGPYTDEYAQISGGPVTYSLIQGLDQYAGGPGNIDGDPLFVDPDGPDHDPATFDDNDYRLAPGSPCIDAGDNAEVALCAVDLDASERLVDDPQTPDGGSGDPPIVDMGAYEFGGQPVADCNSNALGDLCELDEGLRPDCNGNLVPDECDLADGTLHCTTAVPAECDCNANGTADYCDIAEGGSADCNGNFLPDECLDLENDCNGNLVPDECDLADGTSQDCNGNLVPDECDLADGTSQDCNGNLVPDECDIAGVVSEDCHANGIPDECERPDTPVIWYVDRAADPAGGGTSWADACPDLQFALCVARSGDQIWVATGSYTPAGPGGERSARFQLASGVAVYGGFEGTETTLAQRAGLYDQTVLSGDLMGDDIEDLEGFLACYSGDGNPPEPGCESFDEDLDGDVDAADGHIEDNSYRVVSGSGTDHTTVLDGLTISAGNADGASGAGMAWGSPTVTHCTFRGNRADLNGGGMYINGDPAVTRCIFRGNRAASGGGMYVVANDPNVANCTFSGNRATVSGGGMLIGLGSSAVVINSVFSGNRAGQGGGMYVFASNPLVVNCTFGGNGASEIGGGITCSSGSLGVLNTILWANHDTGGANMDESAQITAIEGAVLNVLFSLIQGLDSLSGGPGNIGLDPLFVDPDGDDDTIGTADDDVRLSAGSPAIDAGTQSTQPCRLDRDGHERFFDDPATPDSGSGTPPIVDMGAYEFAAPARPDCNRNALDDACEVVEGLAPDDNGNGVPDECECPTDLSGDWVVDAVDLAVLLGAWGASPDHPADLNSDGAVDAADLAQLLGSWGACAV